MVSCILAMDAVGVRFSLVVSFCPGRKLQHHARPGLLDRGYACEGRRQGAEVLERSKEVTLVPARIFASGGVGPHFVIAAETTSFQIISCHNIVTPHHTR